MPPDGFTPLTAGILSVAVGNLKPGMLEGNSPIDPSGGVEYQMAMELAKRFGLEKVQFMSVGFTPLVSGSASGYDIAMQEIFKTPEREAVNTYSECYHPGPNAALVRKEVTLKSLEDAQKLEWGSLTGSLQTKVVEQIAPATPGKQYTDIAVMYNDLLSGGVEAIMTGLSGAAARQRDPAFEGAYVAAIIQSEAIPDPCSAIQLPKNAPAGNVIAVNKELEDILKPGGLYEEWVATYLTPLGADVSLYPVIKVP